ncbi:MAG: DUF2334 domain-containing protein [Bacillota bacterium]
MTRGKIQGYFRLIVLLAILLVMISVPYFGFRFYERVRGGKNAADIAVPADDIIKAGIGIKYEGEDIKPDLPLYNRNNRYYLPVADMAFKMGGSASVIGSRATVTINNRTAEIDGAAGSCIVKGTAVDMKKILVMNDAVYISVYDFSRLFDMKVAWDYGNNTIMLFNNREKITPREGVKTGKPALIRLEDITAGQRYQTAQSLEKLRVIADYLYSKNIPFYVAWVPRYVNPKEGIDNDPSRNITLYNSDFVYTLDYLTGRNGIIGLHGYTHQYGDEASIDGVEFGDKAYKGEKETRARLEAAIAAARKLEIPVGFFESPHYVATPKQHEIMGEYFDCLYDFTPGGTKKIERVKQGDRVVKYVPTPLNYVNGKYDTDNMIGKINNLPQGDLASFFFHPSIEFEYINLISGSKGYPQYTYSDMSVLHRLFKTFEDKGYKFERIDGIQ